MIDGRSVVADVHGERLHRLERRVGRLEDANARLRAQLERSTAAAVDLYEDVQTVVKGMFGVLSVAAVVGLMVVGGEEGAANVTAACAALFIAALAVLVATALLPVNVAERLAARGSEQGGSQDTV